MLVRPYSTPFAASPKIRSRIDLITLTTILLCSGCNITETQDWENTVNSIESKVKLPKAAAKLSTYARYYAYEPSGAISVVYTFPMEMDADTITADCALLYPGDTKCVEIYSKINLAKAGDRVWVEDYRNLPIVDGGGCSFIKFHYDPETDIISDPICNGPN